MYFLYFPSLSVGNSYLSNTPETEWSRIYVQYKIEYIIILVITNFLIIIDVFSKIKPKHYWLVSSYLLSTRLRDRLVQVKHLEQSWELF